MSIIDLHSGYWQVSVAAEDRDKTCFTCAFGTFLFTRIIFGARDFRSVDGQISIILR